MSEIAGNHLDNRQSAFLSLLALVVLIVALWIIFFSGEEQIESRSRV